MVRRALAASPALALLACATDGPAEAPEREDCAVLPAGAPQASPPSEASPELIAGGTTSYASLLTQPVPGGACPDDYSNVHGCFNAENPPAPSIARTVGLTREGFDDGVAAGFPNSPNIESNTGVGTRHADVGDFQVTPHGRTSNDGRLVMRVPFDSWPQLHVVRPENLGYDSTVMAGPGLVSGVAGEVHGLAMFNPFATNYVTTGANPEVWRALGSGSVNVLHSTVCEDSSADVEGERPGPLPCRARYGTFDYYPRQAQGGDDTYQDGLCYQLTVMSGGHRDRTRDGAGNDHWELRSTPLTVFVRNPYQKTTGTGDARPAAWVYPQNPGGALDAPAADGVYELPDFAAYDLGAVMPWCRMAQDQDLRALVSTPALTLDMSCDAAHPNPQTIDASCYVPSAGTFAPNPAAPPWCEFLFGQRFQGQVHFDDDLDANVDRTDATSTAWNGRGGHTLFELATTGDGDLLLVNNNQGVYYAINDSATPCDASGFRHFLPVSLLPKDQLARARYPVAQTRGGAPLRDSRGSDIPFGSVQRTAYQWIDRRGANLMIAQLNEQRDLYTATTVARVPATGASDAVAFVPDPTTERERHLATLNSRAGHMVSVIGAWTNHKYVVLDDQLNASDFGGGATFATSATNAAGGNASSTEYWPQYTLPLYRDRALRFIPASVSNINSFEHVFGMLDAHRPTTIADVVWTVQSNNQRVSEVAFDEYTSDRPFVLAPMNAALGIDATRLGHGVSSWTRVYDGFTTDDFFSEYPNYRFAAGQIGGVRVQNAATRSSLPDLRVLGGARIEPVALGGVRGKGLYLDGKNDYLDAGYPVRADLHNFYMSMWIEPGVIDTSERTLFHFADQGYVGLALKAPAGGVEPEPTLTIRASTASPPTLVRLGELIAVGRYAHVGIIVATSGLLRTVEVLVNGNSVGRVRVALTALNPARDIGGGWTWFAVGSPYAPVCTATGCTRGTFRGWIDELRVYPVTAADRAAGSGFRELICNHALGTLVATSAATTLELTTTRDRLAALGQTPAALCEQLDLGSHSDPTDFARQLGRGKQCADKVHRNGGNDPACLRTQRLALPALTAEDERPDTRTNAFCLTCHTDSSPIEGLRLSALAPAPDELPRWADRRRQPLNPPATLTLPTGVCTAASPLAGTFYTSIIDHGLELSTRRFTTDHVFDQGLAGTSVRPYFPPTP